MYTQKSSFCFLAFARENGQNHGICVIGWCLCSHNMALSFTKFWWVLCDNICIQGKAARFFGFPPVPLKQAQVILAGCQTYFCFHSQSQKAVLAISAFPDVFCPVKGGCHGFRLNHAMQKHFRNKIQMEMETPSLVSGIYTCMSPQLFCWNWSFKKNPKVIFCISFCQWSAVLQHLPIYLLWITCPKSSAQRAEDEMSLIAARWACSSSHRVSFSPCPHCAWGTVSKLGKTPSCLFLCLNRVGRRWRKKIFSWFYLVLTTRQLISVTSKYLLLWADGFSFSFFSDK